MPRVKAPTDARPIVLALLEAIRTERPAPVGEDHLAILRAELWLTATDE